MQSPDILTFIRTVWFCFLLVRLVRYMPFPLQSDTVEDQVKSRTTFALTFEKGTFALKTKRGTSHPSRWFALSGGNNDCLMMQP